MTDEPENHTIRLLQEMRAEMRERFDKVDARFDDVNLRIDGVTHILTLLAGVPHDHDERIVKLERET